MFALSELAKRYTLAFVICALSLSGGTAFAKHADKGGDQKAKADRDDDENEKKPAKKQEGPAVKAKGQDGSVALEKEIARLQDQLRKLKAAENKSQEPKGKPGKGNDKQAKEDKKSPSKPGQPKTEADDDKPSFSPNLKVPASKLPPGIRKRYLQAGGGKAGKGKEVMVPASQLPPGLVRRYLNGVDLPQKQVKTPEKSDRNSYGDKKGAKKQKDGKEEKDD